ncbi:MAG: DUF1800 family protein [Flavisolibacter sp.]
MSSNQIKNQHLMWRAGFGPAADQVKQLSQISYKELYKALQKASSKKPEYLDVADSYLKGLFMGINDAVVLSKKEMDKDEKKMIREKQRDSIKNLNLSWLNEMVESNAQLREKMAFFWHGHFASRNINIFYQQDMLGIIRENALGNFRDLLHEVSKSAAMLNFLNANQNRKDHPNENFAREVMELFTLGRSHYTEHDIKEAARAFTGWGANLKGEFVFRKFQHDDGNKTILGETGNFDGDNVLDILLKQKETARFIVQKIYRYFVNEVPDKERIEWLADRFYSNDYAISLLMEDIFTSDWFYDDKNIGCRIKSPIELIAGIRRMLPMQIENLNAQLVLQRILGQILFYPPNVAGWPGGKSWIDSSTLMVRMRLPQMINDTDELNVRPKTDDDQMMGHMETQTIVKQKINKKGLPNSINAVIDWNAYLKNFQSTSKENLIPTISNYLLQVKPSFSKNMISDHSDAESKESFLKTATIQVMSTPEYQLC